MNTLPAGHPIAEITIPPDQARDIIILLIDIHGLLEHLHRHGPDPELAAAEAYLRESASNHTLASVIDTVDSLATHLTSAMRHAVIRCRPPAPANQRPTDF